jgi:4-amino-4-deoxy-L-arabinose transferase-like glycosyltransferase
VEDALTRHSHRGRLYVRGSLAIVLVLAIAARAAAYVADPKPDYLAGLTVYQGEMARNIVDHGKWFVVNQEALALMGEQMQTVHGRLVDPEEINFSAVDQDPKYKPEILEVPGLAVPLAGLWWAAGAQRYSYVRWLQIVLDSVMVLLVYWIALQLTQNTRVALTSSLLYALWPGAIVLSKTPSLDSWAGFCVIAALALFLWARSSRWRMARLSLLGALIGVGVYFRPFVILLPIAFAFAELKRRSWRHTLETALVPTLVAAVFIAPWTLRNFVEFHRFIPMRIGIGQALWEGLGETPNSFGAANNDEAALRFVHMHRPDLKYPTPAFDDFLLHKSLHGIAGHPLHYLELVVRRALSLIPCLLALAWRRRFPFDRALLVATAVAVVGPYLFLRMEDRFWLPTMFAYLILLVAVVEGTVRVLAGRHWATAPSSSTRSNGDE